MANEPQTYADADKIINAIRTLEKLEAAGTITKAGQKALDKARRQRKSAERIAAETISQYRGVQSGLSLRFNDEIYGAYKAANDFVKKGDMESAKDAYAKYRDLVRKKNEAAQLVAPDEYTKGDRAGQVMGVFAPSAVAQRSLQGLGIGRQILANLGIGAAASAAPEFGEGEGGFKNRVSNITGTDAAISGAVGATAPVAGQIVQAGMRGARNVLRGGAEGFSGSALRTVGKRVKRAQDAGTEIENYLASLGDEGMIADIPGGPRGAAQALATMDGDGADILRKRLNTRAEGAGDRVEDVMSEQIDKPNVGYEEKLAQKAKRNDELSPMYEAAKKYDKMFDVSKLRQELVLTGNQVKGNSRTEFNNLLTNLSGDQVSAEELHAVRAELSDTIFSNRGSSVALNLQPYLNYIDELLDNVPGYATARTGWKTSRGIDDRVDEGFKVFSGGRTTAMSPRALEDKLAKMTDDERAAFKKGARDYIGALMGTSKNDAAAAWQEFGKNWNAKKLRMVVGEEAAQAVTRRLFAEKVFSETSSDVIKGSQTQFRAEGAEALRDLRDPTTGNAPTPFQRIKGKVFDEPVNKMINDIVYGNSTSNLNRQVGEIMTLQGADRDRVVKVLLEEVERMNDPARAEKIMNALTSAYVTTVGSVTAQE